MERVDHGNTSLQAAEHKFIEYNLTQGPGGKLKADNMIRFAPRHVGASPTRTIQDQLALYGHTTKRREDLYSDRLDRTQVVHDNFRRSIVNHVRLESRSYVMYISCIVRSRLPNRKGIQRPRHCGMSATGRWAT